MLQLINQFIHKSVQSIAPCLLCETAAQQRYSICHDCWQTLPHFQSSVQRQEINIQVACHYDYPINRIIQQFKYEKSLHYQHILSGLMVNMRLPRVQAVVPMPVSSERLAERGYNQSVILARQVASHLNVPLWQPVKRLNQYSQKGLSRLERMENIESQFIAQPPSALRYRKVLIVDDVVTTGSSIHALKLQLEALGCQQIYSACIAAAE